MLVWSFLLFFWVFFVLRIMIDFDLILFVLFEELRGGGDDKATIT